MFQPTKVRSITNLGVILRHPAISIYNAIIDSKITFDMLMKWSQRVVQRDKKSAVSGIETFLYITSTLPIELQRIVISHSLMRVDIINYPKSFADALAFGLYSELTLFYASKDTIQVKWFYSDEISIVPENYHKYKVFLYKLPIKEIMSPMIQTDVFELAKRRQCKEVTYVYDSSLHSLLSSDDPALLEKITSLFCADCVLPKRELFNKLKNTAKLAIELDDLFCDFEGLTEIAERVRTLEITLESEVLLTYPDFQKVLEKPSVRVEINQMDITSGDEVISLCTDQNVNSVIVEGKFESLPQFKKLDTAILRAPPPFKYEVESGSVKTLVMKTKMGQINCSFKRMAKLKSIILTDCIVEESFNSIPDFVDFVHIHCTSLKHDFRKYIPPKFMSSLCLLDFQVDKLFDLNQCEHLRLLELTDIFYTSKVNEDLSFWSRIPLSVQQINIGYSTQGLLIHTQKKLMEIDFKDPSREIELTFTFEDPFIQIITSVNSDLSLTERKLSLPYILIKNLSKSVKLVVDESVNGVFYHKDNLSNLELHSEDGQALRTFFFSSSDLHAKSLSRPKTSADRLKSIDSMNNMF